MYFNFVPIFNVLDIAGVPGIGKTACVNKVIANLNVKLPMKYLYFVGSRATYGFHKLSQFVKPFENLSAATERADRNRTSESTRLK